MYYFSLALTLTAAVTGVWSYGSLTSAMRVLCWLCLVGLITESIGYFSSGWLNHMTYSLFTLADGILVWMIYSRLRKDKGRMEDGMLMLWLLFLLCNTLFIQTGTSLPTNNIIATSLLAIFLGLNYFRRLLELPPMASLFSLPGFWFTASLLVYNAVTFFRWTVLALSDVEGLRTMFMVVNMWAVVILLPARIYCFVLEVKNHERRSDLEY